MHVVKAIHHLMEVGPGNFFWEFTSLGNKVKELPSSNKLEDNGETIVCCFIFVFIGGIFPDTEQFNQIFMLKLLHNS